MTLDGCLPSLSVKRGAGYAAVRRAAGGRNVEGIVNTKGGAFRNHVDSAAFEGAVSLVAPRRTAEPRGAYTSPRLASPHLTDMRVFSRARSGAFRRRVSRTLANTSCSTVSCRDTTSETPGAVYDVVSEYRKRLRFSLGVRPMCHPGANLFSRCSKPDASRYI